MHQATVPFSQREGPPARSRSSRRCTAIGGGSMGVKGPSVVRQCHGIPRSRRGMGAVQGWGVRSPGRLHHSQTTRRL